MGCPGGMLVWPHLVLCTFAEVSTSPGPPLPFPSPSSDSLAGTLLSSGQEGISYDGQEGKPQDEDHDGEQSAVLVALGTLVLNAQLSPGPCSLAWLMVNWDTRPVCCTYVCW